MEIFKNEDLETFVACYIKVGNNYGMIDSVHGERFGFVWSNKDSWTGQLVDAKDVILLDNKDDFETARLSALHYFEREVKSLQARINMGRKQDDLTTLVNMLSRCEYWLGRLS